VSVGKPSPGKSPLRAPQADGTALFVPPLAQAKEMIARNVALAAQRDYDFHGRSLHDLSLAARSDLLQAAREYTGRYADTSWLPADSAERAFVLSGHQPELFHSGVWLKNFALSSLGQSLGAVAINLIVDNDAAHAAAIRVPTGSPVEPRVEAIQLDAPQAEIPWEERRIGDRAMFASTADRALAAIEPFRSRSRRPQYTPIMQLLWPRAVAAAQQPGDQARLGKVLAQARHEYEHSLGLRTLELPLSEVCRATSFRWFAVHLLLELPRLQEVYNDCLSEYRRANHIRSRSHPVPELETRDDWREVPLWVWSTVRPHRQRLFARHDSQRIELTDFAGFRAELPLRGRTPDGSLDDAVEQLANLERQGIKLRTRALLTTMYARLVLGDLFLHGIGGAKYDELTDAIIRRFFHCAPPEFLTATATVRLPIERPALNSATVRALDRALRDVRYHPEGFVGERSIADPDRFLELVRQKQGMLAEYSLRGASREDFERFDALNRQMFAALQAKREQLAAERAQAQTLSRTAALLGSREFSFVLFPSETLPRLLLDLCAARS
jgi:hypothetical protein